MSIKDMEFILTMYINDNADDYRSMDDEDKQLYKAIKSVLDYIHKNEHRKEQRGKRQNYGNSVRCS